MNSVSEYFKERKSFLLAALAVALVILFTLLLNGSGSQFLYSLF